MKKAMLAGLIVVLLAGIGLEEAIAQRWAMDGAGCVPTDAAIQNDLYSITAGRIKCLRTPRWARLSSPVRLPLGSATLMLFSFRIVTPPECIPMREYRWLYVVSTSVREG